MKLSEVVVGVLAAFVAVGAWADPATGWKQTGAGPYDYNDTANWVNGEINGVFGSDLTLTADQTITFASDATLASGLSIAYAGNFHLTFQSDGGGAKTLTLGGDLAVSISGTSVKNGHATPVVTIGGGTDDTALIVDLGGENRTIDAAATKGGILSVPAVIQNGALAVSGTSPVKLSGANTYAGGTTLDGSNYIYVGSETSFGTGDVIVNGQSSFCASTTVTLSSANVFYINAANVFHRVNKNVKLDMGQGDVILTNSVNLWAEGDGSFTLHGAIKDADGKFKPNKIVKYGSKTFTTYSDWESADGERISIQNGTWNFYGQISGAAFAVVGPTSSGTGHLKLMSDNSFSGMLELESGAVYVYAQSARSVPEDVQIKIGKGTYLVGSANRTVSSLLSSGCIDANSDGTLCLGCNESGDIDLSACPNLALGSQGGTFTCSGTVTWPSGGTVRLGGASTITLNQPNAMPNGTHVEICGPVTLTALNESDSEVKVVSGGTLALSNAEGALPNAKIIVEAGGTLSLAADERSDVEVLRATDVTLMAGSLSFSGNKTNKVRHKIGRLTLDGRESGGGTPQVYWGSNDYYSKQTTLEIESIVRPNFCLVHFAGGSATLGATEFTGAWNIIVNDGVETFGGGTMGTVTTPIVPWVYYSGTQFVTYDPTKGFRVLNSQTERTTYSAAASIDGPTVENENMLFSAGAGGVLELTGAESRLTSFAFGYQGNKMTVTSPNGKILVTGGGIACDGNSTTTLGANVDFGANRGYIIERAGKGQTFSGTIAGSGGLTIGNFSSGNGLTSSGTGLACSFGASTFTGDVHIFDRLDTVKDGCFPYGDRSGNVYLHGFWVCGNNAVSLNGLFGAGTFYLRNGYNVTLNLGSDGSDGDFTGNIERTTGNFGLTKIGSGRQRLAGAYGHNSGSKVEEGALQVDGSFTASAVTVSTGATLAGCGTFAKGVTLADRATLEVGSAKVGSEDAEMNLDGGLTLSGDATLHVKVLSPDAVGRASTASVAGTGFVTVDLDDEPLKIGEYLLVKSASAFPCTFKKGANCGALSLRNDGTELWMSRLRGLKFFVR